MNEYNKNLLLEVKTLIEDTDSNSSTHKIMMQDFLLINYGQKALCLFPTVCNELRMYKDLK